MILGLCANTNNIETAIDIGYDYVVLSGAEVAGMDDTAYKKLEELIITKEIPVLGINGICPPTIDIAGPEYSDGVSRKYIEKLIQRAARLGVKNIGIGAPKSRRIPAGYSRKQAWNNARSFVSLVAEEAENYDMNVSIEGLTYKYCNCINTLEESRLMMDAVDKENVGIIIDFFHMEADGYPVNAAEEYIEFAKDIHISGIDSAEIPGRPFVGARDQQKLNDIAAVLLNQGYNRTVTLEPDPANDCFREKAEEAYNVMRKAFNN